MTNHFKNFIEKKRSSRVIFTDYATRQEIEFTKDEKKYYITFAEFVNGKFEKKEHLIKKDLFYKKISEVVENTIYNERDYKLTNYTKLDTLLSVKFN